MVAVEVAVVAVAVAIVSVDAILLPASADCGSYGADYGLSISWDAGQEMVSTNANGFSTSYDFESGQLRNKRHSSGRNAESSPSSGLKGCLFVFMLFFGIFFLLYKARS